MHRINSASHHALIYRWGKMYTLYIYIYIFIFKDSGTHKCRGKCFFTIATRPPYMYMHLLCLLPWLKYKATCGFIHFEIWWPNTLINIILVVHYNHWHNDLYIDRNLRIGLLPLLLEVWILQSDTTVLLITYPQTCCVWITNKVLDSVCVSVDLTCF